MVVNVDGGRRSPTSFAPGEPDDCRVVHPLEHLGNLPSRVAHLRSARLGAAWLYSRIRDTIYEQGRLAYCDCSLDVVRCDWCAGVLEMNYRLFSDFSYAHDIQTSGQE